MFIKIVKLHIYMIIEKKYYLTIKNKNHIRLYLYKLKLKYLKLIIYIIIG